MNEKLVLCDTPGHILSYIGKSPQARRTFRNTRALTRIF
jgi:hypothetical protein